jgi:hypothetical protein
MKLSKQKLKQADIIGQGKLKKSGETFEIAFLNKKHFNEVSDFHNHIASGLNENEKEFFLEKPAAFFNDFFNQSKENKAISVIFNGTIIAQSLSVNPSYKHPKTGMVDMKPCGRPSETTILQGVGVLPSFQGNGLMQAITKSWLMNAKAQGKKHALAEVEVRNIASWSSFLKEGLSIHSLGVDPMDGAILYNLHENIDQAINKPVSPLFNKSSRGEIFVCHPGNLEKQQDLLNVGYKGIAYNKKNERIIFQKI